MSGGASPSASAIPAASLRTATVAGFSYRESVHSSSPIGTVAGCQYPARPRSCAWPSTRMVSLAMTIVWSLPSDVELNLPAMATTPVEPHG